MGPDIFFVERNIGVDTSGDVASAKAVCAGCPVSAECLAYALAHNERHGIWGGASVREREKMRRKLRQSRQTVTTGLIPPTYPRPSTSSTTI